MRATRDFFIRKAIGSALRDHARHDPAWVRALLEDSGDRLSPLSAGGVETPLSRRR